MTETNIARILVMLMQGNTRETASLSVGISPRTLQEWMRDNPEIADQIYEAEANCESQYVNVVHETAIGGGKQALSAAILMLERRNPAAWAAQPVMTLLRVISKSANWPKNCAAKVFP